MSSVRVSIFENPHDQSDRSLLVRGTYYDDHNNIISVEEAVPAHWSVGDVRNIVLRKLRKGVGDTLINNALRDHGD